MPVAADQMLAHYRLAERIGEGGMGAIWRARDTTLDRDVAIKVLPSDFASDPERLARFEREAKVLASLNHPCIAQVYGFHEADGIRFLAMELVQGEDLAQRLTGGPLPLKETQRIARRIAQALEAAHESGVIHRDLKPANILLTPDGGAKVLDFGLAKVFEPDPMSGSSESRSPTVTSGGTQAGVILGTAAYMSPEQARGRPLDRRSDIWSFGCVVYEMLTGRHLFRGETFSDTIALILQTEPDWSALPGGTPARLCELLVRCLDKDPRNRLRDIGDARIELDRLLEGGDTSAVADDGTLAVPARTSRRPARGLLAALFLLGAVTGAGLWSLRPAATERANRTLRVSVPVPPGIELSDPAVEANRVDLRVTPDGRAVVFLGVRTGSGPSAGGPTRLYVRSLDSAEARPLPGTEGASLPTLSPDGGWAAYRAPVGDGSSQRRVFKVPLDGSAPPLALADWGPWVNTMLWLPGGEILVLHGRPVSMVKIATDGSGAGAPIPTDAGEILELLVYDFLPDGVHVLAHSGSWEGPGYRSVAYLLNTETGSVRKLLDPAGYPRWAPTGHILFSRGETLLAAPFDPDRLELTGGPIALADGLRTSPFDYGANFDLSRAGTLASQAGGRPRRRLVTVTVDGSVTPWSPDRLSIVSPVSMAPDGRYIATSVMSHETLRFDIWISETARPGLRMWMTIPQLDCSRPLWHPDSRHLLFACNGTVAEDGIYMAPLDKSTPPRLLYTEQSETTAGATEVLDIHPAGRHVLVHSATGGRSEILRLELRDGAGPFDATPLIPDRQRSRDATFSPDGNWVAFVSDDAGRPELFVVPFRDDGSVGLSTLVSRGATGPRWIEDDGLQLAFAEADSWRGSKVRLRVTPSGPVVSEPEPFVDLSAIRPSLSLTNILPDGRIFAAQEEDLSEHHRIDLVIGFDRELERLKTP